MHEHPGSDRLIQTIKKLIIKVYVIVYEYQIRIILHYAHGKPSKTLRDVFQHDEWKKMTSDINDKDLEIDRAVNTAMHISLRERLKEIDTSVKSTMSQVLDTQNEISTKLDVCCF